MEVLLGTMWFIWNTANIHGKGSGLKTLNIFKWFLNLFAVFSNILFGILCSKYIFN